VKIIQATSLEDIAAVRRLFEEYARRSRPTCAFRLCNGTGGPARRLRPAARPVVVDDSRGRTGGCVALRPKDERSCEMKRLYIRPVHQGRGWGRRLAQHAIAEARTLGYTTLLLDTLPSMQAAIKLYESLGFAQRAPYFDSPVAGTSS